MSDSDLLERLAAHKVLQGVPREELAWLVAHGTLRRFAVGQVVSKKGEPVLEMMIQLSGLLVIYMDRGGNRRKVFESRAGELTGLLPYSRLQITTGIPIFEEESEVLSIHRDQFPEMIRECPTVTATGVHVMLDRARHFTSTDLQDEKMISLGRLAAALVY